MAEDRRPQERPRRDAFRVFALVALVLAALAMVAGIVVVVAAFLLVGS